MTKVAVVVAAATGKPDILNRDIIAIETIIGMAVVAVENARFKTIGIATTVIGTVIEASVGITTHKARTGRIIGQKCSRMTRRWMKIKHPSICQKSI